MLRKLTMVFFLITILTLTCQSEATWRSENIQSKLDKQLSTEEGILQIFDKIIAGEQEYFLREAVEALARNACPLNIDESLLTEKVFERAKRAFEISLTFRRSVYRRNLLRFIICFDTAQAYDFAYSNLTVDTSDISELRFNDYRLGYLARMGHEKSIKKLVNGNPTWIERKSYSAINMNIRQLAFCRRIECVEALLNWLDFDGFPLSLNCIYCVKGRAAAKLKDIPEGFPTDSVKFYTYLRPEHIEHVRKWFRENPNFEIKKFNSPVGSFDVETPDENRTSNMATILVIIIILIIMTCCSYNILKSS